MYRPHEKIFEKIGICVDLSITTAAFVLSYYVRKYHFLDIFGELTSSPNYYTVLCLILIIWYLSNSYFGLNKKIYSKSYSEIIFNLFKSITAGFILLNFTLYMIKIPDVSRLLQLVFCFLNFIMLSIYKILLLKWLRKRYHRNNKFKNLLFVGFNEKAANITNFIISLPYPEYRIIGCLSIDGDQSKSKSCGPLQTLGKIDKMEKILKDFAIDEIIFSTPPIKIKNFEKYLELCDHTGATVHILPDWDMGKYSRFLKIEVMNFHLIANIPALSIGSTSRVSDAILIKYFFDYMFSALILFFCFPLFIIIAIAIKMTSKGPILFTQERIGLFGRKFKLFKFRTMTEDAEKVREQLECFNECDGPVFKIKNDPRIIPYIGPILRKTGLDELPQLINVLKGEMSLVGPRPPIQSEVDKYDFWQRRRLSMKPGITCLWQVETNRNDIPFNEWIKLDLSYIDNWSLSLDVRIIFRTLFVVLGAQGR
jgi:exopolysaccharide biosynthesis polyprenyl glycosylphosphotransferase